jgi:hypothetical protein
VGAIVDSGADQTLFPLSVAADLGLSENELEDDPAGAAGVGSMFSTWLAPVGIRGWVLRRGVGGATLRWGPELRLDPVFAEPQFALLGRSDFFPHFRITFETDAIGPIFHLDAA